MTILFWFPFIGLYYCIMKRTYQPSKIKRARTHGFMARMHSTGGIKVLKRRRAKGRKRLTVWFLTRPNYLKKYFFMGSFSFSKSERLLNRKDFVNLNRSGQKDHTAHFTIIYIDNGLGITRLGITVSKKIGNSVKRNRLKRLIREFFRLHKTCFPRGYDIVISAKKGACNLDFWKIKEELGGFVLDKKFRI